MNISHFCIDRPVFASVVSIVITLAGAVAMYNLPIAQYPEITPVEISVTAIYPGASAEVAAQNVAAPIEQQVNGADKLLYMSSASSSSGVMTLSVYFDIDANPSLAQVEVQNRVNLALPLLPASVQAQGVSVKKQSASMMMVISVYSPDERYQPVYVSNYASIFMLDAIKRIPGAGQATVMGTPDYAMRVWLKPDRMAALGITAADVQQAVAAQNEQYAVGSIGQSPTDRPVEQSFAITTKSRLTTPEEFDNIIIRAASEGAAIVRLKDVGYSELGQKSYSLRTTRQGKPATVLVVYQQPGANALEVAKGVRATLEEMKKSFPPGIEYEITMDTTAFTRASIESVILTFFEALALVVVVVFVFLQNLRSTLIPIIAVPISVIGAAMGMAALDFSLNMLTMFGMILTIGIVVDDAIVVVEAVEHNMTKFGLSARDAAKKAMDEVGGALIAIVLVLCAVFVPVAFIPGITGQLYKQFAITIAISVVLSGIVALTLSPALAALLLKPVHGEKRGFFKWFDIWFARMTEGYIRSVQLIIKHFIVALLLFAGMIVLSFGLLKQIPGSFLPPEDQGVVLGAVLMPDASGLDRTGGVSQHATDYFMNHPAAKSIVVMDGFSLLDGQMKSNAATFFVGLKDFKERYADDNARTQSVPALMASAAKSFSRITEGIILPLNPPSIPGLGTTGGMELYIQSKGDNDSQQIAATIDEYLAQARTRPELANITSTYNAAAQVLRLDVDRAKAETLGIAVEDVYTTMQTMFGSVFVSQFAKFSRLFQVIIQGEPASRLTPKDIDYVYVRSRNGIMIPLSAVATTHFDRGPDVVTRFNNFTAVKVTAEAAPGFSSGEAIAAMEETAANILPGDYGTAWSGQTFEEKKAGGSSSLVFVFGLIMVYLILAAQYEKWSLPLGVLAAVPFALFGALAAIFARGLSNDIYFQIGLTMLIALAAKNAILIIEYAVMNRAAGQSIHDAAVNAARDRLRPIIMTSLAFTLGCVPLAIATGVSANSKISLGTGTVGGMLGATVIAIFFIPMFYWAIETFTSKRSSKDRISPERGVKVAQGDNFAPELESTPQDKPKAD
ncbi:efflux RND transporter permease subunit [Nitrosospira briensis]|uniref:efflux RND transporter permease subunit n=1 Tax=Nitrosospira briensis TaxID=35799 RepID=UPI00046940E8|nr:efflux RND transporter permease subunit [Nitrosospira briensis]